LPIFPAANEGSTLENIDQLLNTFENAFSLTLFKKTEAAISTLKIIQEAACDKLILMHIRCSK
jgi:hypothetical protein